MLNWQKIGQRTKNIGYRTLVFKKFRLPDGNEREFTTYGQDGAKDVAVIALTPEHRVIIARQFRPGPEKVFDELPGGSVDPGEDLVVAAQRELQEETGYSAGRLEYIGLAYRDAYNNAEANYFIGYDCVKTAEQQLEQSEFVEVATISIDKLLDNARNGKMTDAPAALMAYDILTK